jgi:polysaccharide pyruvyl transferase WcaK-like protein
MKPDAPDRPITVLLDHGEGNVGDEAMLLAVVLDLRRLLGHARFLVASPSDACAPFLDELPGVRRVPSPNLCCRLTWRPLTAALGRGWRWNVRTRVERALRPARASRLARHLTAGPRGAEAPADRLAAALAEADAVHIVGGGYLNDRWAHAMIWPKWALARAARARGTPVFVTGQGIGPLERRRHRRAVREIVAAAETFTLREERRSPDLLAQIGCSAGSYQFAGDDALTLPPAGADEVRAFLRRCDVRRREAYVCANVRFAGYTGGYDREVAGLAALLDRLCTAADLPVLFVPMSVTEDCDDAAAARQVVRRMARRDRCQVVESAPSPPVARALTAGARACVGLSYHFCLFALSGGVPAIMPYRGAYYVGKIEGLADAFGVPELAVAFEELGGSRSEKLVERLAERPAIWREPLREASARMADAVTRIREAEAETIRRRANREGAGA